jgi:hypothetical protein
MRCVRVFVTTFVTIAVVVITPACATTSSAGGSRRNADVITTAEMEQYLDEDLLNLIQRARPAWLQTRPALSAQGANAIVVVLDGVPQEPGLGPLRGFKVADVQEVRRLSASDATTRFGTGMTGGAILIVTKR